MFRSHPRIDTLPIAGHHACHVIDDALVDPGALVEHAVRHAADFVETAHNAYPGPELRMPDAFSAQLDAFFSQHLRQRFDVRRTERMYSRLALTTMPPERLRPLQSLCHVDRLGVAPGQRIVACVLYLFTDPPLGGTAFYTPKHPPEVIVPLLEDAARLDAAAFERRHGLRPGYMTASNAWFEKRLSVPARFNRLVVYEGTVFHSGEIRHPERLSTDPRRGRLTLNGFFTCRRRLAG
jgi:hypothetical protein